MAFVNQQEVTATLGPAVSTALIGVAAFTLGNIAIMSVTARADASATNNWDSQVTAEPLPGTNQIRVSRAGNSGTVVVRVVFVEDTSANCQHVKFTALVGGANNATISAITLSQSWAQTLGMKAQGNRDDDTSAVVNLTSTTNLQATLTSAPTGGELNVLAIEWPGASVQNITNTSVANWAAPITSVDTARSFTWMSEIVSLTSIWRNDEIDTYDLIGATFFRATRFLTIGSNANTRRAFVIEMPVGALVSVQRGRATVTSGGSSVTHTVTATLEPRSIAKGCGGVHGHYNFQEETGTNVNQERATFETEQTSPTQVVQRRTVTTLDAIVSMELLTWDIPPNNAPPTRHRRRRKKRTTMITPRELLNQTLPAVGADVASPAMALSRYQQPDLVQFMIQYDSTGALSAYEAQIELTHEDDPATATEWFSVPAFDETAPVSAAPDIDVNFGEANWVNVGVPSGSGFVRLLAEVGGATGARIRMRESGDTANPGDVVVTGLGK